MNKKFSIKFCRIDIELLLMLLVLIKPACLYIYPTIENVVNVLRVLITLYLILKLIRVKLSEPLLVVGFYCVAMLIPTIIYNGALIKAGNYIISALSAILLYIVYRKYIANIIKVVLFILEIYIFINLVLMLLYPDGMYIYDGYKSWLLGMKNGFSSYFLCAICMRLVYNSINNETKKGLGMFIAILISSLIGGSSTLLVVLALFLLLFCLSYTRFRKYLNYKFLTIFYMVLFFGIVILRFQNLFEFIIVDVLNKDLTFTNRTYIWDKAIRAFMNNKPFGVGIQSIENLSKYIVLEHSQVHNQILDYALNGGILLLSAAALLNVMLWKSMKSKRNEAVCIIISITTFLLHITMLTESLYSFWMYIVFFLGFFVNDIIENKEKIEVKKI